MKKSPLTCIFRVVGNDLDIDAILAGTTIRPFRIDRAGVEEAKTNALHYDVSVAEPVSSSELETTLLEFMTKNKRDILIIRQARGIEQLVLDVAVTIDDGTMTRTLALSQSLLEAVTDAGLSFEISAYRG